MESAAPPSVPPNSKSEQPAVLTAWPRSAQLALAFLLGLATALIAIHAYSCSRWGSRPTDLERGPGLSYRIDLNHAERPELLQIPGIGDALAQRIEDHRREHGAFRSVEELTLVHGIGPATLERVRSWVQVSPVANTDATPPGNKPVARKPTSGPKISQRIVDERSKGTFKSVDDLRRVQGIGPKTLERLRPYIRATPEPQRVAAAD